MSQQAACVNVFDFSGAMVVVTGAASGLGLGIAQAFHAAGARVAMGDVRKDAVESAAPGWEASGYRRHPSDPHRLPVTGDNLPKPMVWRSSRIPDFEGAAGRHDGGLNDEAGL